MPIFFILTVILVLNLLKFEVNLLDQQRQLSQISYNFLLMSRMKWSKFIKDDNKFLNPTSLTKLNSSRSGSNQSRDLALKSIQKMKLQFSTSKLHKNVSSSSINSKDQKIKSILHKHISQYPSRQLIHQFQSANNLENQFKNRDEFQGVFDQFRKEFSEFIKKFIDKIKGRSIEVQQELGKRLINLTQQIINNNLQQKSHPSVVRKSISCVENGSSFILKERNSQKKKKQSAIMKFKNQKVQQRNNFTRIENSINQVNIILQKQKRVPRFSRTSRLNNERSGDSSVQQVIERSLSDSKKVYKSRMKSKDLLYNMNKILNQ